MFILFARRISNREISTIRIYLYRTKLEIHCIIKIVRLQETEKLSLAVKFVYIQCSFEKFRKYFTFILHEILSKIWLVFLSLDNFREKVGVEYKENLIHLKFLSKKKQKSKRFPNL